MYDIGMVVSLCLFCSEKARFCFHAFSVFTEGIFYSRNSQFENTLSGDAELSDVEKESNMPYRVKIYQIDTDRDKDRLIFAGSDVLMKNKPALEIDASIYDEVFSGELESKVPEELFALFNTRGHPLHRGHSMSVSDVIVTEDGAFFCDSYDFKKISFDESKTRKPDNLLRIVYVEPGKPAYEAEVMDSLHSLQRAVGNGLIEHILMEDNCAYIGNDAAKLIGMKGNRRYGKGGVIAGPFLICGCAGETYRSLTDDEVKYYLEKFKVPEDISDDETQADTGFRFIPL